MITCPYCGNILLVAAAADPKLHAPNVTTGVLLECRCTSRFEVTVRTLRKAPDVEIEKHKRPVQLAETYDQHGNRKQIEHKKLFNPRRDGV